MVKKPSSKDKRVPIREWWMCPLYSAQEVQGVPERVFGRDLDDAFRMFRTLHPTAAGWKCLGRVNPKNREFSTTRDAGIVKRVVRVEP